MNWFKKEETKNYVRVIEANPSNSDNGSVVTVEVELTKEGKKRFQKPFKISKRVKFTLYSDRYSDIGKSFGFEKCKYPEYYNTDWNCPYSIISRENSNKFPFFGVDTKFLMSLIDEFWKKKGIEVSGKWY